MEINVDGIIIPQSGVRTSVVKPNFPKDYRQKNFYLKQSYPSGFYTNNVRKKIIHKVGDVALSDSESIKVPLTNPYGSFTEWTKGDINSDYLEYSDFDNNSSNKDPYADVAGPYLSDLMRNKFNSKESISNMSNEINNFDSIFTSEMPIHERSRTSMKANKKKVI